MPRLINTGGGAIGVAIGGVFVFVEDGPRGDGDKRLKRRHARVPV
jgi:hypothetical protein